MENIKLQWIQKTMTTAQAMGFQIVIVDTDGVTHGKLQEPNRKRKPLQFPMGAIKKHIAMHIPLEQMPIGEVFKIPGAEYGVERIQSCLSSYLSRTYGKDAHISTLNREHDFVEVMRTA